MMKLEDQDSMVSLKLSSKEIDAMTVDLLAPAKKLRPKSKVKHVEGPTSLSVRSNFSKESLNELAECHPSYALWLQIVLLRLMVRTPALSRLKDRVDYNMVRVCEFLGFTNFEEFVQSRSLSQIRSELEAALYALEATAHTQPRLPLILASNLHQPRRPPKVPHLWPPKLLHPARGDQMH